MNPFTMQYISYLQYTIQVTLPFRTLTITLMANRAPQATSSVGSDLHNSYHKFMQGSKLCVIHFSYYNKVGQSSKLYTIQLVLVPKYIRSSKSCKPSMQSEVASLHFALTFPSFVVHAALPFFHSSCYSILLPQFVLLYSSSIVGATLSFFHSLRYSVLILGPKFTSIYPHPN